MYQYEMTLRVTFKVGLSLKVWWKTQLTNEQTKTTENSSLRVQNWIVLVCKKLKKRIVAIRHREKPIVVALKK